MRILRKFHCGGLTFACVCKNKIKNTYAVRERTGKRRRIDATLAPKVTTPPRITASNLSCAMCLHAFPLRLHFKIAQPHSSVFSSRIQAFAIQTIPTTGTHCLKHNTRDFTNPSAQDLASLSAPRGPLPYARNLPSPRKKPPTRTRLFPRRRHTPTRAALFPAIGAESPHPLPENLLRP